jgi:hypothetical protein
VYKIRSQIMQRRQESGGQRLIPGTSEWMRRKQQQRQRPRRTAEEKALQIRLDTEAKQAQMGVNRSLSPGESLLAPLTAPPPGPTLRKGSPRKTATGR